MEIVQELASQRDEWKNKAESYRKQYFSVKEEDFTISGEENSNCQKDQEKKNWRKLVSSNISLWSFLQSNKQILKANSIK